MALPASGAITLKQISTEFSASNTIKSCATAASLSTSNIKLKDFYGLSAAIDPVYIQEVPATSMTGWNADGIVSGYVRDLTSIPPAKIPIGYATAAVSREITCTPGVTYTVSCRSDHSGIPNGCIHGVYDKASYDDSSVATIVCGESAAFTDSANKFTSFTFVAVNASNYVRFFVRGSDIESSFNSNASNAYAKSDVKEVRIEL